MKLYHLTPRSNVESIKCEGIIPFKNENGMSSRFIIEHEEWRKKVVWLTHDPEYILKYHAPYSNAYALLTIDIDEEQLKRREKPAYENSKGEDVEYLVFGTIHPSQIISIEYK